MRLLLDTCTFLWIVRAAPELSLTARDLFQDPESEVFLSAVSVWEISAADSDHPARDAEMNQRRQHRLTTQVLQGLGIGGQLAAVPGRHL